MKSSGDIIAVASSQGDVLFLSNENGSQIQMIRAGNTSIQSLDFNPVGDVVAVATDTGAIFLYSVGKHCKKLGRMSCKVSENSENRQKC